VEASPSRPRVVIVGAGFGGLYAAKALRRAAADVLVIDRRNHHLFQPLLYQVATAALSAPDVARPIRGILRASANTTVLLGDVTAVDTERRRVAFEGREERYDYLILAPGVEPNYFGHDEWARHAPALKTLADAFEYRRRMLYAFEAAEREEDPERRAPWQTFVVVGAGPTGVELAGALREIATQTLARDFRRTDVLRTRVVLVDLAERVLGEFPAELSHAAAEMLERRGVELRLARRVTGIDERGVDLTSSTIVERIESRTVFWAAGVRPSGLARSLNVPLSKDGRVLVAPDLSLPGHPEVFVVGDLARFEQDGRAVPGMAPAAIQEGRHAAENVLRAMRGLPPLPFRYRDRGLLATIGRSAAVARVGRIELTGFAAWVLWLVVHVAWLIGFRNRVVVLFEWAWAYLTFQRSARVAADLERGPSG
jgi:NADH dehydrogenase